MNEWWREVDPFEVSVEDGWVVLDGRACTPETARQLSRALRAAANRAEGLPAGATGSMSDDM
jgi:hypothetical protein